LVREVLGSCRISKGTIRSKGLDQVVGL